MRIIVLLLGIAIGFGWIPALAVETQQGLVGSVAGAQGTVSILRDGKSNVAQKGFRLYQSDVVRTAEKSSVGIVLRDDSTLSMGPSTELRMADFTFRPDAGALSMTLKIVKGTLAYVSGQIAKLAPGAVQIETPEGVAAVRGTELLVEVRK